MLGLTHHPSTRHPLPATRHPRPATRHPRKSPAVRKGVQNRNGNSNSERALSRQSFDHFDVMCSMIRSNVRGLLLAMIKKRTVVNEKLFSIECVAISMNDKFQIQFDQGIKPSSFICQFQKVLPC